MDTSVTGTKWLDQDIYLIDLEELVVNVNTLNELQLAEQLMIKKAKL